MAPSHAHPRGLSLGVLFAAAACSVSVPPLDYQGLSCATGDDCGGGLSCVAFICGGPSGSTGGSSGVQRGTSGSSSTAGSSTAGSSTGGTTGAGSTSGGSTSGGSTSTGSTSGGTTRLPSPPPPPPILAVGRAHACQALPSGAVQCWGNDRAGQLGDGTLVSSWAPVPVLGVGGGVVSVAAGGDQSCALQDGGVICWGAESGGNPADNLSYDTTPTYVAGLFSGASWLALGATHGCAVQEGAVLCWGGDGQGQLGNGSFNSSATPASVGGLGPAIAVAAGDYHTCALLDGGGVACWGANGVGQLGTGQSGAPADTPQAVAGLGPCTALAAGSSHSCALAGGKVYCWGSNAAGQLGTTFEPNGSTSPVPVQGIGETVWQIVGGGDHACALTGSGAVWCWGDGTHGELGDGTDAGQSPVPVTVTGIAGGAVALAAGAVATCAELDGGTVVCWGYGGDGELGDSTAANAAAPVPLSAPVIPPDGGSAGDAGWADGGAAGSLLAAGLGTIFELAPGGLVWAWGSNLYGQLGDGTVVAALSPRSIPGLANLVALSAGADHACGVVDGGAVLCWGANDLGQLGNGGGASSLSPVSVSLPAPASAVACGGAHSCAIAGGGLYCWGENPDGELGDGTVTPSPSPVAVRGLTTGVGAVAAAANITCAIADGGDLFCWGANATGQLGNGNGQLNNGQGISSPVPAQVTRLTSGVVQVAIGANHGCALLDGGGVQFWGANFFGELGDGNAIVQSAPIAPVGLDAGVSSVTVGSHHSCVLTTGGAVVCWGRGSYGELGNGPTADINLTPSLVPGLTGVTAVAAGDESTCAVAGGTVVCWGYGGDGSLGQGTLGNASVPGPVR